jgi:nucleoside-diphosphate-sugar epimerase
MANWWIGKKVLVTGGAGFIGSHLVPRLLMQGAKVRAVDNLERGKLAYIQESLPQIDFRRADLQDAAVCESACRDVEVVFHLASKVGGIGFYLQQAGEVFRQNTLIDHNVWSAALKHGVPYYFYASSAHVYPITLQETPDSPPIHENQAYPANPELSYGWAKLLGEKLIQFSIAQGCTSRAAIARLIGAYGPNQDLDLATGSAIPVFCRRALEYPSQGPFIVASGGTETRSYHFVSDTVDAILRAVEKLQDKTMVGPFNLGSEERISIGELARQIIAISGKPIEIVWQTNHPTAIWGQVLDCQLARELLDGWKPVVSMREGLQRCYEHIVGRLAGVPSHA